MSLIKSLLTGVALVVVLTGCSSTINKPNPMTWKLPHKTSPDSGMIIGRLETPANKKENPEGHTLYLGNVMLNDVGKFVRMNYDLQDPDIMENNYFVFSNIKPGKYKMVAFFANIRHGLAGVDGYTVEVKPGQIAFLGSYDYIKNEPTLFQKLRKTGTFGLRKAQQPTELEMFQWLEKIGSGSGWESAIRKRIQELSGQS